MPVLSVANANLFADDPKPKPLRVIAYNIFGLHWLATPTQAWLSKLSPKARWQSGWRWNWHSTIPTSSTSQNRPSEELTKEVAELLGMNHVRFPSGGNWPGTLLSKFEIIESQNAPLDGERPKELFTRHWGRATIKLPNGDPLIVHSAHLVPDR